MQIRPLSSWFRSCFCYVMSSVLVLIFAVTFLWAVTSTATEPSERVQHKAQVNAALQGLLSSDPTARRNAVISLGRLKVRDAVPELIKVLDDSEVSVRRAAIIALGRIGDVKSIEAIIAQLEDENPGVRMDAIVALAKFHKQEVSVVIRQHLKDPHPVVRQKTAEVLGEIGDISSQGDLIGALSDESESMRICVIDALVKLKAMDSLAKLKKIVTHDRVPTVRARAAWAIGEMKDKTGKRVLKRALGDPSLKVQLAAAGALGMLHDSRGYRLAIEAAESESPIIRIEAAKALGAIGLKKIVPVLEKLAKDSDNRVKRAAERALEKMRSGVRR